MGGKAKAFLRFLARVKYGDENKVASAQFVAFHRTHIAVAVQRGNAVAFNRWRGKCAVAAGGAAA